MCSGVPAWSSFISQSMQWKVSPYHMPQPHFLDVSSKKTEKVATSPRRRTGQSQAATQANNSILNRNDRNLINTREYVAQSAESDHPMRPISLVWLQRDMGMQQHGREGWQLVVVIEGEGGEQVSLT